MKIDNSGSLPVPHTAPEHQTPLPQRTTRQHPINLDSQPPEPVPQERPARPSLELLLGSDLPKDHLLGKDTPPSQMGRISNWLRLQMTALRQTAESVFIGAKDETPPQQPTSPDSSVKKAGRDVNDPDPQG